MGRAVGHPIPEPKLTTHHLWLEMGVKVVGIRSDSTLHNLVWDVQYATVHTFNGTGAASRGLLSEWDGSAE